MSTQRRRRTAAVSLAVVGVAGLTLASAAQLNVNSASLAAGTTVVAACDPDGVDVGFETAFSGGAYAATDVTVDGIAEDCAGQAIRVTLSDGAGVVLEEVAGTVQQGGGTFVGPLTTPVDAATVDAAAVLIHG